MPQRLVHYAIAKKLIDKNIIKNEYKFIIGSLIPDCNDHTKQHHSLTHYISINENKKTVDFNTFFEKYENNILEDDIYLGYYIHLITDAVYRHFMYNIKDLRKYRKDENFSQKLYSDYNILNKILIEKYNLEKIDIHENVIPKELNLSDISEFQKDFDSDFEKKNDNQLYYLTDKIIYEFIEYAVDILYNHIVDLKNGNIKLLELYWW